MSKEQQTKYPWHEAPEWAMWAATDEDAHWYALEPWISLPGSCWMLDLEDDNFKEIGYLPELRADWENSLEKIPGT